MSTAGTPAVRIMGQDPRDLACRAVAMRRRVSRVNEFGGEPCHFPPNFRSCRARRQGTQAIITIDAGTPPSPRVRPAVAVRLLAGSLGTAAQPAAFAAAPTAAREASPDEPNGSHSILVGRAVSGEPCQRGVAVVSSERPASYARIWGQSVHHVRLRRLLVGPRRRGDLGQRDGGDLPPGAPPDGMQQNGGLRVEKTEALRFSLRRTGRPAGGSAPVNTAGLS